MTSLKIHEQIAFLRRQKGLTQEELAKALGVSNQAVSKWEAGQCCPDIGLLPDIAALFGVTIDQLMGYGPAKSFDRLYLDIKAHFEQLPEADCFDRAFRLAVLLHEAACSKGYKARLPWSAEKNHGLEPGPFHWGFSVCSEPEGSTVLSEAGVFLTVGTHKEAKPAQLQAMFQLLKTLGDPDTFKTLFALYSLTAEVNQYASLPDLAAKAKLSPEAAGKALEHIPVETAPGDETLYRLAGCFMHIPPLLMLLCEQ